MSRGQGTGFGLKAIRPRMCSTVCHLMLNNLLLADSLRHLCYVGRWTTPILRSNLSRDEPDH